MVLYHVVNFIGLLLLYVAEWMLFKYTPPYHEYDMLEYATKKIILMAERCCNTYMTLVLFYLVYCFGRNRQLG